MRILGTIADEGESGAQSRKLKFANTLAPFAMVAESIPAIGVPPDAFAETSWKAQTVNDAGPKL